MDERWKSNGLKRPSSSGTLSSDDGWISVKKQTRGTSVANFSNGTPPESPPSRKINYTSLKPNFNVHPNLDPKFDSLLSDQQMKALKEVALQKSVFLTGSAGTGKSFMLEFAIRQLKSMYGPESVFVTASTGIAACNIGGITLHSFAGIGLGNSDKYSLLEKVSLNRMSKSRWVQAKALVIDEISMIEADLLDKLDYIGKNIRKNHEKALGGIQLVVSGDFFQLPPVNISNTKKSFAFEAECWSKCFHLEIELNQVFRQSDDEFIQILNEIRKGRCSQHSLQKLDDCSIRHACYNDGISLTKLYPHKVDVRRENEENLRRLNEVEVVYNSKDEAKSEFQLKLLENSRAEKLLILKAGAQVILTKNLDAALGLVNGARGVVLGFCDPDEAYVKDQKHSIKSICPMGTLPVVKFALNQRELIISPETWAIEDGGKVVASRTQLPLLLAWALSVHKCQGLTLDRVQTDLTKAFDYGMVYVALSRVRSLEGLHLTAFQPSKIKAHPKVVQFYSNLKSQ